MNKFKFFVSLPLRILGLFLEGVLSLVVVILYSPYLLFKSLRKSYFKAAVSDINMVLLKKEGNKLMFGDRVVAYVDSSSNILLNEEGDHNA